MPLYKSPNEQQLNIKFIDTYQSEFNFFLSTLHLKMHPWNLNINLCHVPIKVLILKKIICTLGTNIFKMIGLLLLMYRYRYIIPGKMIAGIYLVAYSWRFCNVSSYLHWIMDKHLLKQCHYPKFENAKYKWHYIWSFNAFIIDWTARTL